MFLTSDPSFQLPMSHVLILIVDVSSLFWLGHLPCPKCMVLTLLLGTSLFVPLQPSSISFIKFRVLVFGVHVQNPSFLLRDCFH